MEVSDQRHAPAALPPVSIKQEDGWSPEPFWKFKDYKIRLLLPRIKLRP